MMNESNMKLDLISRQDAIDALERKKDKNAKGDIGGFYNKIIQNDIDALMQLPSAEQDVPDTNVGDIISRQAAIDAVLNLNVENRVSWRDAVIDTIDAVPSAQPETHDKRTETHACDLISRQAAIDAMTNTLWHYPNECYRNLNKYEFAKGLAELGLKSVPSAQPTIYGYNVEHLETIARVLQKENLPPERVVEILIDIGRIVSIICDEFEDNLRKAVEQCMT